MFSYPILYVTEHTHAYNSARATTCFSSSSSITGINMRRNLVTILSLTYILQYADTQYAKIRRHLSRYLSGALSHLFDKAQSFHALVAIHTHTTCNKTRRSLRLPTIHSTISLDVTTDSGTIHIIQ